MVCSKCSAGNTRGATVCRNCGAKLGVIKPPPAAITVNLQKKVQEEEKDFVHERSSKGILAVIMAAGLVVIAGLVVVAVLCLSQPEGSAQTSLPAQALQATPEPAPTPEPTPTPTPTEDYSSILEPPSEGLLTE